MIPEVCLFFNYKLFRGCRSTKVSASDFAAFSSPNFPPLGIISSLRTHISWELIERPMHLEPFSIQTNSATGEVACLRIFPGIEPRMVEAVLRLDGLKGLVLETFGSGNAPGGPDGALTKVFAEAIERGIVIVNITQCMTGTVNILYEPAMLLKRAGVIPGHDMTTEAALAKLSYLLAVPGLSTEHVVQKMSVSLRGEFTEQSNMVFEHPYGVLPDRLVYLASLGYAISSGNVSEVQKLLTGDQVGWMLDLADYSGNTPLVSTHELLTGNSKLTFHDSILLLQDPVWKSCGCCWKKALQCTCEIAPAERLCSSQPMPDSPNTSPYSKCQGPISTQTSSVLLGCTLSVHQTHGEWLEWHAVEQSQDVLAYRI